MSGIIPKPRMQLHFKPYKLELKHTFTLAGSSRSSTPVVLTQIDFDGFRGFGEASMPPYLGETIETAISFLSKVKLESFNDPLQLDEILSYVDKIAPGNTAAKAAVDIALHDLIGKLLAKPWYKIWQLNPDNTPNTSFTIGIDTPEMIKKKVLEAADYKLLKVKLGRENDREIIETIRSLTKQPLCVDVNQGWQDKHLALDTIFWLAENGVQFIEQPLPKTKQNEIAWLTDKSPLPIIADEAVQRLPDVKKAAGIYSGINIKLMKCTGMNEAYKMIEMAESLGLQAMIGCMTETSCAISAAAQLSPKSQWADLDGNLLINNDPFKGVTIENGKITLNNQPGIGIYDS